MNQRNFYYNCSSDYIRKIDPTVLSEVTTLIQALTKSKTQAEINHDILILLCQNGWSFDAAPSQDSILKKDNNRRLCLTSTTLDAGWHTDFAKEFNSQLVQLEVQFGKVESMFKDFCGFQIAYSERRLSLGIEIVMSDPSHYFAHRKASI